MKSIADINAIMDRMQPQIILRRSVDADTTRVIVGMGTRGIDAGAREVFNTLVDCVVEDRIAHVKVTRSATLGYEGMEPVVVVKAPTGESIVYAHVDSAKAQRIFREHLVGGQFVTDLVTLG